MRITDYLKPLRSRVTLFGAVFARGTPQTSRTSRRRQLDKIDTSDPKKNVAEAVAIGVLGLGMCVQLVFLVATLFKSDRKPTAADWEAVGSEAAA